MTSEIDILEEWVEEWGKELKKELHCSEPFPGKKCCFNCHAIDRAVADLKERVGKMKPKEHRSLRHRLKLYIAGFEEAKRKLIGKGVRE